MAKGRVSGLALGGAEADGQIESEGRIGVVGLSVEVESLAVVAERVGRSERGQRRVGGLSGVLDGSCQVDGLGGVEPVAGQFAHTCTGPVAAKVLQRLGHHSVRPRPAVRAQVLVQRVLDERVREVVTPVRIGHLAHQRHRRRCFEDVEQVVL